MPELPEVELYCRYFARHALHQRIAGVRVLDERILGVRKAALTRALVGHELTRVRRHGKHLFADAGASWLHIHFGMSGDLYFYDHDDEQPRFARVVFEFENGARLAYDDMRLFGVVDITPDPDTFIAEYRLGPDPLDAAFRLAVFKRIAAKRRGAVKSLLLSQDIIAGMGNLYVEVKSIFTCMRAILKEAIAFKSRGGDYPGRWLVQRREEGETCPVCRGTIQRTVVFGRTTYFCGTHQKA
jgi:formamidopyrimidine-DNA glycosylase